MGIGIRCSFQCNLYHNTLISIIIVILSYAAWGKYIQLFRYAHQRSHASDLQGDVLLNGIIVNVMNIIYTILQYNSVKFCCFSFLLRMC